MSKQKTPPGVKTTNRQPTHDSKKKTMAETHTLTIKAELDTSSIQGKLDQLN